MKLVVNGYKTGMIKTTGVDTMAVKQKLKILGAKKYASSNSKCHPTFCHEGPDGEQRYSSTLSLTSALDVGGWLTPRPGRFTPGKIPSTHFTGGWVGARPILVCSGIISSPPIFDPRTVQPVSRCRTD